MLESSCNRGGSGLSPWVSSGPGFKRIFLYPSILNLRHLLLYLGAWWKCSFSGLSPTSFVNTLGFHCSVDTVVALLLLSPVSLSGHFLESFHHPRERNSYPLTCLPVSVLPRVPLRLLLCTSVRPVLHHPCRYFFQPSEIT